MAVKARAQPSKRLLRIKLPPPHARQAEIEACDSSRVVVNCGRRAGKTFLCARKAVGEASRGRKVLYAAPVASQTDSFWELCGDWLSDGILTGMIHKNETKRTITFPSGGRIVARTAYKPNHMRGTWADYLILDEFAFQDPEVWEKVGMPMLLDNGGNAIFPSTPDGRNHFYHMFLRASSGEDPRWKAFKFSSEENPFLSREALKELTEDMTENDYAQEIQAEFLEGVGAVFRLNYDDFLPAPDFFEVCDEHEGHRLIAGLDWGQIKDSTVLSVGCATCSKEVVLDRFKEVDYPTQRDRIKGTYDTFKLAGFELEILAESNAMGLPNIEQLRQDGVPTQAFATSAVSKPPLVQGLRLCFEQRAWKWIENEVATRELEAYTAKVTGNGNIKYSAPSGLHDDTVIARMLMFHQAMTGTFTLA